MRLIVPDMQAISRRLTELADGARGRYDGWAAGKAPAPAAAPIEVVLKRFETPDETRELEHGKFELVQLGGLTIGVPPISPGGSGRRTSGRHSGSAAARWSTSDWCSRGRPPRPSTMAR